MKTKYDERTRPDYQRRVGEFVNREVVQCVSTLVWDLTHKMEDDDSFDLWQAFDADQARDLIADEIKCDPDLAEETEGFDLDDDDDLQTAIDVCRVDRSDCEREVFEHWIVSNWLADKLEAHGETVVKDWHGLTIWARTTTGQAILLDDVVCRIYDETQRP